MMHRLQGLWTGVPATVPSGAPQLAQSFREGVAAAPFFFFFFEVAVLLAILMWSYGEERRDHGHNSQTVSVVGSSSTRGDGVH